MVATDVNGVEGNKIKSYNMNYKEIYTATNISVTVMKKRLSI